MRPDTDVATRMQTAVRSNTQADRADGQCDLAHRMTVREPAEQAATNVAEVTEVTEAVEVVERRERRQRWEGSGKCGCKEAGEPGVRLWREGRRCDTESTRWRDAAARGCSGEGGGEWIAAARAVLAVVAAARVAAMRPAQAAEVAMARRAAARHGGGAMARRRGERRQR